MTEPAQLITDMGRKARAAFSQLTGVSDAQKSTALTAAARHLRASEQNILEANQRDMSSARDRDLSDSMLDRLMIDAERLEAIAAAVEHVGKLPDPVGQVIDRSERPNGLVMERVRVPLGVIGIIYESRPNVTADAAALALRSGNAVILRGGSEAIQSNGAIYEAMVAGVVEAGLPADAIQLVQTTDRAAVGAMLKASGLIDIIIPRGGKSLVKRVQDEARVPVLAHLDGICHTYIAKDADPDKALAIAVNAKMRRTGICGAMETLLIDQDYPAPGPLVRALLESGCEIRGDDSVLELDERVVSADASDWDTEYLAPVLSVGMVDGVDEALAHIAEHGSHHTDVIVTEDTDMAERFILRADSAIVMHNASSQFADGGQFGLGAEIGISTGRLHARGPVALEGLTTYKWVVRGTGQTRP
ncbi:MAG: glutamate-5-semialdehyde dehydrogenase [Parasphingorhabdus sp.]|nr:glutamate-5-semialdehyde dehydrogenase [Parasphingorhabdus sp.]